ncbi:hypothetical protein FsymDg_3126 [Candidatus Protofrankia datiscae]|uniref:Uncharacterized protein n=1 Tax=Candidatus Protofrankia datiscae TaxID=2716812 RepID=F8AYD2_9ACTN|nr:hypothetical protein FsymDg_3126 [Candidatus Protofrankia datiscae]
MNSVIAGDATRSMPEGLTRGSKAEKAWVFRSVGGHGLRAVDGVVPSDMPVGIREVTRRDRRRPPSWLLQLVGLSLGGLVAGIAIGFRLPA